MIGRHGIKTISKNVLDFLYAHFFFLNSFSPYLIQYIGGNNRKNPKPGDHYSNLKKVGSILYRFNTTEVTIMNYYIGFITCFKVVCIPI